MRKPMKLHLKKGALHKALGVSAGKKIPVSRLEAAKNSDSALMRKRANFALTAAKWHHGGQRYRRRKPRK